MSWKEWIANWTKINRKLKIEQKWNEQRQQAAKICAVDSAITLPSPLVLQVPSRPSPSLRSSPLHPPTHCMSDTVSHPCHLHSRPVPYRARPWSDTGRCRSGAGTARPVGPAHRRRGAHPIRPHSRPGRYRRLRPAYRRPWHTAGSPTDTLKVGTEKGLW